MAGLVLIERTRVMTGSSPGCAQPSLALLVRVARVDAPKGLHERIREGFGSLPGVQLPAADDDVPRLFAQLCLALLRAQGLPVFGAPDPVLLRQGAWRIVIPTESGLHTLARQLAEAAAAAFNALAEGAADAPLAAVARVLERVGREAPHGKNTVPMLAAADKLGIPWERLAAGIYRLGHGSRARWVRSSITDRTPSLGVSLARSKADTATLLRRQNIPVPDHFVVRNEAEALRAAARLGYPVVVKPADLDRGTGVASRLRTEEAVRRAYREAARHSANVLVESHFFGEDHRIHVFEGEVFRVRHRVPGGVTGDGTSTVEQLLATLNADPRRGAPGSNDELIRIDMDDEALELLAERGFTPASVPAAGDYVQLRRIANVSVGGVSLPVRVEDVHPDNLALAVRAVAAIKLDLAAVDFLIPDIRRSWFEVGAAICEINAQPQFGADAPEWLFARMFPHRGRIPIVVTMRSAPWVAQVRDQARGLGLRLGYADAQGTWVGDTRVSRELPGGVYHGATLLAGDAAVDAMLLVVDRQFITRGTVTDRFDALVDAPAQEDVPTELAGVLARCSATVLEDSEGVGREVLEILGGTKGRAAF